jgi:hypothetical protein
MNGILHFRKGGEPTRREEAEPTGIRRLILSHLDMPYVGGGRGNVSGVLSANSQRLQLKILGVIALWLLVRFPRRRRGIVLRL